MGAGLGPGLTSSGHRYCLLGLLWAAGRVDPLSLSCFRPWA